MIDHVIKKRFFNKVEKSDYCWNWTGGKRHGYGAIHIEKKTYAAHRLSWEIHYGKIPENLFVCHKCDNRKCVNPDHLFLGNNKDNMNDCFKKGRMKIPNLEMFRFKHGHKPKNIKVPIHLVSKIKKIIREDPDKKLIEISNQFNVPYQYVRDISCGRTYKNVV